MSFTQTLILALALLVVLVLVTINFFYWKNWCETKDHIHRICGIEKEFELRAKVEQGSHDFELKRMALNHEQVMERDKAIREGSPTGVGGYS